MNRETCAIYNGNEIKTSVFNRNQSLKKHMKVPSDVRINAQHSNGQKKGPYKKERFSFHNKWAVTLAYLPWSVNLNNNRIK